MEERNDWEKLNHITEEYDPDPDLAYRAIEKINQREATVTFKKAPNKQAVCAASLVGLIVVIFLSIFLPLYLTRNRVQILLYKADEVELSAISDLDSYVQDNNLNVKYFTEGMPINQVATIKENKNIAYIMQDCFFITGTDLDNINLKAVVLQNAEFDFYNDFRANTNSLILNNIMVDYNSNTNNNQNVINCKFNYQNVSYFLEIKTADSGTQVIEKYVEMLINQ